jgi:hypothetical protein
MHLHDKRLAVLLSRSATGKKRTTTTYLFETIPIPDRLGHDGAKLIVNGKFTSNSWERSQDIREKNAAVCFIISPRLKGNLYGYFRNLAALTKRRVLLR